MFTKTFKVIVSLLCVSVFLLVNRPEPLSQNGGVSDSSFLAGPSLASANSLASDFSHRYVIFLDGIRSYSPGLDGSGNPKPLSSDFGSIKEELLGIGIPGDHFVYFSYRAAYHQSIGELYCLGWGIYNGCSNSDLASVSLTPVYDADDTKQFSIESHAEALDWLLGQVVQLDPSAQIDLVGFSLGGIVASHWASQIGGTSSVRDNIHAIVIIESPVGGIPLGGHIDDNCWVSLDPAICQVTQGLLRDMFGETILKELQLPYDVPDSIVDTLPQAAINFPDKITAIQSTADYLVNHRSIPLEICFPEPGCWLIQENVLALGGDGAQYWVPPPARIYDDEELGGRGLADPDRYLSRSEASDLISINHNEPLHHSQTAQWVSQAIQADTTSPPTNPVDVYFIVDLTGSYGDDLPRFKAAAPGIISTLKAANSDIRFGLGKFEDYPISPFGSASAGDKAYQRLVDLTSDTNQVLNVISGLATRSGADAPESQLAALYQAATGAGQDLSSAGFPGASIPPEQQANFRAEATKVLLLWTDAPFHLPADPGAIPYPGPSFDQTINAINGLSGPKVVGIYSSTDAGLSSFSNQGELEQTSVTAASALSDLERIVMATGTFAPAGGVDCNNDGAIDIPAGSPIICSISSTGEGIGEAIVAVVGAATKPNAIYLPIIQKSGSSTPPPGNHAPYVPSNLLPAHNAMNVPAITELTWTGGDPDAGDVVSYDVYLEVNNSNPTRLICNDAFATNCNPPGSLLYNADYYWKVVATDKRGANTSSSIVHFKTGDIPNYPPDIPDNPIPTDGAPDQSVNISLNWTGGDPNPADTVMYDVYLDANDSNPTTLVCSNLSTTTCNLSENLLYDTDYFWKVVATDSHSASSSNIVWYFKTGNTSCDTPGTLNLVSPSDGTVAYDNKPTFTWNVASASSEYQLQVDDNIDFSSPEIDATVATLDYKPNSALHAVTYYWRVRGHNTSSGCNLFGPWSSTRSFSIDSSAIWSSPINLSNSLGTADDPDVAIGPDNSIHMVWNDNSSGSYDILYASKTSDGEWSIPVNVSNQSGDARHPAISVDSSGTVHVSWGNGFIYFAQKTSSGSWTTPETAGVGFKPRIAVGNDDTIHLAWVGSSFGNFEIYYAVKFSDGSWSPPVNLSNTGASSFDPDIDLDSQNRPHVVWDDTEPGSAEIFYVTKFGDGSWSTIENISNDGNGSRFARIAIDSTDGIHVCWIITFGPRCNYKPTSGSWSGIDHTLNSHFSHRVVPAVGADDLLRVAWTSGYDIFYSKQVGGEWLTPLNVSENGIPTIGVILGLDSKAGIDALVWADESGGSGDVYYSEATGDEIWSANAEIAGFDAVPDLLPIPTPTPAPNPR